MQFENVVAEAAYYLWQHMPDAYGSFECNGNLHVLVDYSPVLLLNIERYDTAARLNDATRGRAGTAWIVVLPVAGQVVVREAALTSYSRPLVEAFEAFGEKVDAAS